jgi:sugar lactone lactonase YvrE
MRTGAGDYTYEWIEGWAEIPDTDSARRGWSHPGMVVNAAGEVVTFHGSEPVLLVFDTDGHLLRTIETNLTEGHGLAISQEDRGEFLWIVDTGSKRHARDRYQYPPELPDGRVVKMGMDGQIVMSIERPDLEIYRGNRFSPTMVAIHEERFGGNGDVWVADGYGQSQVHRFDRQGRYDGSLDGREGDAGAFSCPHSIWIDTRKAEPELYVADRANHRIQVYDMVGQFKRALGQDFLVSPSGFARDGDLLIVAELHARLTVLDKDDRFVCYLGRNDAVCQLEGWPNMLGADGVPARTDRLEAGKFNSPHGMAVDGRGNIYVSEWLIGGRTVKLAKV